MASKKISALTDRVTLTGSEQIPIAIGGLNYYTTPTELSTYTGTILRPYKIYSALLTQTSTSAPTIVVLENTLGVTLTGSYNSTGNYELIASSAIFTSGKTFVTMATPFVVGQTEPKIGTYFRSTTTRIVILVQGYDGTSYNGGLNSTSIEIRVYP